MFSFFVPLLLMNLLIAIMSDVYERVQSNVNSADARILAEMIFEMEELVKYYKESIRKQSIEGEYKYIFYTSNH